MADVPDILHETDVRAVIEDEIETKVGKTGAAIADLAALTGGESPTETEYNLVVTKFNALLAVLRTNGIIAAT